GRDEVRVARESGEVVAAKVGDLRPGTVEPTRLDMRPGERGPPARKGGDLAHEELEVIGHLTEPQLLVSELEHLDPVGLERIGGPGALAEAENLGCGELPVVPAAFEERSHRAMGRCVDEQVRVAQLCRELCTPFEVDVRVVEAAVVEKRDSSPCSSSR